MSEDIDYDAELSKEINEESIRMVNFGEVEVRVAASVIAARDKGLWVNISGMEVPIAEMSDDYLSNLVDFVEAKDPFNYLPLITSEMKKRGLTIMFGDT